MKFNIIVIDPPFYFNDKLSMSNVARGAEANYPLLKEEDLLKLNIKQLSAENSILALWVPSSLLPLGLNLMKEWGFVHKQTYIWAKIKKDPLSSFKNKILKSQNIDEIKETIKNIDQNIFNNILSFGMGRTFRNCHEIALIGTKGKILQNLKNKSQRTMSFNINKRHSEKPEDLQNSLDLMFPSPDLKRIEIFARRKRENWTCIGFDAPDTLKQDIRISIQKLIEQN